MSKEKIQIVHEDNDLVIVNKPADFLTIPDRFDADKPNLFSWLQHKYGQIFTVHRLDKETSGIVCFAKTEQAHQHLSAQFEQRKVKKIYTALVNGHLASPTGIIDAPIAPSETRPGAVVINKRGKASVTHYEVIEQFKNFSLVEADIKTGRMHQIRIHFRHLGHPLAIDKLYGIREAIYIKDIKNHKFNDKANNEPVPLMQRTTLHAHRLSLQHPGTGQDLIFEVPLPKDFNALLNQLRKWGK